VASLLRMQTAWDTFEQGNDHPAAAYLASLAVELMLQALAHLDRAEHDARHDLSRWLDKCSPGFQDAVKRSYQSEWSHLVTAWQNGLRYYSEAQWLRAARSQPGW